MITFTSPISHVSDPWPGMQWKSREPLSCHSACAGMCGFSMGGVHACMVASLYPGPVACVPLLAPRSAATAFCHGALREATAWQPLLAVADEAQKVTHGMACCCLPIR